MAFLICTDLDRTLLPNGAEPESENARARFGQLVDLPEVTLAYVSGRHRELVEDAIRQYALPQPDFVVTDVGTRIYTVNKSNWSAWPEWEQQIAPDWAGYDHAGLQTLFDDVAGIRLQETSKQNTYKLSYYVPLDVDEEPLLASLRVRLEQHGIDASLVWSIDEPAGIGLLDVLPARATKLHAIEFLIEHLELTPGNTLFAGDSGNDLPVLTSTIPSVLVANASAGVKATARQDAVTAGTMDSLYLARGNFLGMNGNYSAGILEGVAHFLPQLAARLTD